MAGLKLHRNLCARPPRASSKDKVQPPVCAPRLGFYPHRPNPSRLHPTPPIRDWDQWFDGRRDLPHSSSKGWGGCWAGSNCMLNRHAGLKAKAKGTTGEGKGKEAKPGASSPPPLASAGALDGKGSSGQGRERQGRRGAGAARFGPTPLLLLLLPPACPSLLLLLLLRGSSRRLQYTYPLNPQHLPDKLFQLTQWPAPPPSSLPPSWPSSPW